MQKKDKGIILLICALFLFSNIAVAFASTPPFPGLPHSVWGGVKNQRGEPLPDGTIVKAIVDNEIYYGTVMNGIFGFNETQYPLNPPFFVEDPENNNQGKTIYFYVGLINTTQTLTFVSGGNTQLSLVIHDGSGQNGNGGGTQPPTNGGAPPSDIAAPVAHAGGPYFGCVNRTIFFDGSQSKDSDGTIVSYLWDFGDGATGTSINPTHIYTQTGIYTVMLTVTDNDGLSDNDTTIVSITNDSDGDGWSDEEEERYGTDPYDPLDYPFDRDGDLIPDIIDLDNDNDGLPDALELNLGSNPYDPSDVFQVIFQDQIFFFVDIDADGIPDLYVDKNSGLNTTLFESTEFRVFYVDTNDDGSWNYVYNFNDGTVSLYSEQKSYSTFDTSYLIYGAIMVMFVVIVVFAIYRRKSGGKK